MAEGGAPGSGPPEDRTPYTPSGRRRLLLVGALLLLAPGQALAQGLRCPPAAVFPGRGSISGRVLDASTDVWVGAVYVTLRALTQEQTVSTRADGSGRFLFCMVPPGPYVLEAVFPGFGHGLARFQVQADTHLDQDLILSLQDPAKSTGRLKGRVIMAQGGDPLSGALVSLNGGEHTRTTDETGAFDFPRISTGAVEIQVSLFGYEESRGGLVVGGGQTLDIEVRLSPQPFEMEPIVVTSTRVEGRGMLADVEIRAQRGFGTVLLDEDLALRRNVYQTTDILQEHGADILGNGKALVFRRTGCGPTVYVDGIRITHGELRRGDDAAVDAAEAINMVLPGEIYAMEIYRGPAEIPGEFLDSNARCGVVLIWTKRGR